MFSRYRPADWYWSVSGDIGNVFSSSKAAAVSIDDPDYRAWVEAGNHPTSIPSFAELFDLLLAQAPAVAARAGAAFARSKLLTPQQRRRYALTGSLRVECASAPEVNGSYGIAATDLERLASLSGSGAETMGLADSGGIVHRWPASHLQILYEAARGHIAAIYAAEAHALAGGEPAWPEALVKIP
jgi:hypothetical protein